MKSIFQSLVLIGALCSAYSYGMDNAYQALRSRLVGVGRAIENCTNVPGVGKLTNLLPFAILAASFKECPMQTMLVLMTVSAYLLSQNEYLNNHLENQSFFGFLRRKNALPHNNFLNDETLFIFDGEDELDAEEEMHNEDEVLFGEDTSDEFKKQILLQQKARNRFI